MASRPKTTSLLAMRNWQSSVKRAKNAAMSVSAAASSARVVSRADDEGAVVVTVASSRGMGQARDRAANRDIRCAAVATGDGGDVEGVGEMGCTGPGGFGPTILDVTPRTGPPPAPARAPCQGTS